MTSHNEQIALLQLLLLEGAMTDAQLETAIGTDQTDVVGWAEDAEALGLVETVVGSTAVRRWQITDAGREVVGKPAGR